MVRSKDWDFPKLLYSKHIVEHWVRWYGRVSIRTGSSIGILLSALLFGMLKLGGQGMPLIAGVPTELVDVVIAAIIFFVGISYLIRFLLAKASGSKKK